MTINISLEPSNNTIKQLGLNRIATIKYCIIALNVMKCNKKIKQIQTYCNQICSAIRIKSINGIGQNKLILILNKNDNRNHRILCILWISFFHGE